MAPGSCLAASLVASVLWVCEPVVPVVVTILTIVQHVGSIYDVRLLVRTGVGLVGWAGLAGFLLRWWFLLGILGLVFVGDPQEFCLHSLLFGYQELSPQPAVGGLVSGVSSGHQPPFLASGFSGWSVYFYFWSYRPYTYYW